LLPYPLEQVLILLTKSYYLISQPFVPNEGINGVDVFVMEALYAIAKENNQIGERKERGCNHDEKIDQQLFSARREELICVRSFRQTRFFRVLPTADAANGRSQLFGSTSAHWFPPWFPRYRISKTGNVLFAIYATATNSMRIYVHSYLLAYASNLSIGSIQPEPNLLLSIRLNQNQAVKLFESVHHRHHLSV
jgi:hypothetical protein